MGGVDSTVRQSALRGLSEEMGIRADEVGLSAPWLDVRADGVRVLCVARCML